MLFSDAMQEIVDKLDSAGIVSTTEPSQLQLPGALVVPGLLTFDFLDGETFSANFEIYLLTRNNGSVQSLNDLQDLLTKFRTVFDPLEAAHISIPLTNVAGPDPVPGLLITLQATITKD